MTSDAWTIAREAHRRALEHMGTIFRALQVRNAELGLRGLSECRNALQALSLALEEIAEAERSDTDPPPSAAEILRANTQE